MAKGKVFLTSLCIVCLVLGLRVFPLMAGSDKPITWKVQSVYKGAAAEEDKRVLKGIEELTDGRLKFQVFQSGELVKANEILDAVRTGIVQGGTDFPSYWSGKDTAFDLIATSPVSMSLMDFAMWYHKGGGKEIIQEVYGKYGCIYLPYSFMGPESGFRTNKPIKSIEDFKGLKLRTAGFMTGKILQALGAAPTAIAFSEIYESLQRGVIDGCEVSTPHWDWILGFQEITKYVCKPSWHQPYALQGLIMNKKAWETLPESLKRLVETGLEAEMHRHSYELIYRDALAAKKFKDYGITITKLSDADLDRLEKIKVKIQEELAAENPLYAKILKSQMEFMKSFSDYREAIAPYFPSRNPKTYPELK